MSIANIMSIELTTQSYTEMNAKSHKKTAKAKKNMKGKKKQTVIVE